jgi:glyoxylase-like metal-dependent hydrolase (beta-lactamase superfamily II)
MKKSPPVLKKVAEDIYLVSVPVPLMQQVNCYLFRGERGFTVVDTGLYTPEGIAIWERIMALGFTIEKIVLTHFHLDHIGLAKWFQEKHHVPVFISSLGYEEMKRRRKGDYTDWVISFFQQHDGLRLFKTAIENQLAMENQVMDIYEFEPDGLLEDSQYITLGNEIYETVWTPGHSPDHYCFYNHRREVMVIGDHILDQISPVILIESSADVNPLMNYFDSLEKVKEYSIKLALPGHGNLIGNLNKRIEKIKSGHHYRMEQILESLKDEEKTAGQMSQEIYSKGSSKLAYSPIMSTITRCIYLESIGKLKSECITGKRLYRLAD